jgi:hypothetical protein
MWGGRLVFDRSLKLKTPSCVMASGSQKRLTTVHDRAALRVHPDGTKVASRESRYVIEDLRGNRIAKNAGGTGHVKKRKWAVISDEESEQFETETDEYQSSENQSTSTDSLAGEVESEEEVNKPKRQKKDPRTTKRARFHQNFDFVLSGKNGAETLSASRNPLLPSSVGYAFPRIWCLADFLTEQDLLKCLHHFAAEYYSDRGQLIDASRIAREKKKAKTNIDGGNESGSQSTMDFLPDEGPDHAHPDVAPTTSAMLQTPKRKGRQGADLVRDMYKMFDGSALVALGR